MLLIYLLEVVFLPLLCLYLILTYVVHYYIPIV